MFFFFQFVLFTSLLILRLLCSFFCFWIWISNQMLLNLYVSFRLPISWLSQSPNNTHKTEPKTSLNKLVIFWYSKLNFFLMEWRFFVNKMKFVTPVLSCLRLSLEIILCTSLFKCKLKISPQWPFVHCSYYFLVATYLTICVFLERIHMRSNINT